MSCACACACVCEWFINRIRDTNTLMTASRHVSAKLLTVSRMSKVDYRNKVLPIIELFTQYLCI